MHDEYTLVNQEIKPLIQQGLVNGDPDVDAIYRLTRELPIFFKENSPLCLPHGTMAPLNSQNTIFRYEAFWGLVFPISVSWRAGDIWRGYWVQRLLWDLMGNICYLPATAIQERNAHNYFKDFTEELDVYTKTQSLISSLVTWQSTEPRLSDRITSIIAMLVQKNFFGTQEIEFMQAWLKDLRDIGYDNCDQIFL